MWFHDQYPFTAHGMLVVQLSTVFCRICLIGMSDYIP